MASITIEARLYLVAGGGWGRGGPLEPTSLPSTGTAFVQTAGNMSPALQSAVAMAGLVCCELAQRGCFRALRAVGGRAWL